jgi:hypothetical protein
VALLRRPWERDGHRRSRPSAWRGVRLRGENDATRPGQRKGRSTATLPRVG